MKDLRIIVLLLLVGLLMGCQTNVPKETQTESSMEQTSEAVKEIVPFEIPEEMKVYEYEGENFLGLRATYVMPGFFACKFSTDQEFALAYNKDTYQTYRCIDEGDIITPMPSESVLFDGFLYVIVRFDGKEELPEIYMRSNAGISFSVMNLNEPQIEMSYNEDRGNLDLHFIRVTQKYDSKLAKWSEKEVDDNPYKIGVIFD
ncbi:MAG: hypothetical protein IKH28_00390 [Lachnospiraceae bacterium]|nr:hypothetical protein [Lachnospiraceae bacterium]